MYQLDYVIKTPKRTVIPRSKKQRDYIKALKESEIVISNGPTGTGKTISLTCGVLAFIKNYKINNPNSKKL